jgi:hypothetical protein
MFDLQIKKNPSSLSKSAVNVVYGDFDMFITTNVSLRLILKVCFSFSKT